MATSALRITSSRRGVRGLVVERDADRGGEEQLPRGVRHRRRQRAPDHLGEGHHPVRVALGEEDDAEAVAGDARQRVLRAQQPAEAARQGEQDRIASGETDGSR